MKKIPCMISTKDLAYITDIFNWNITISKRLELYSKSCKDDEVCKEFSKLKKIHLKACNEMTNLLKECECNEG